MRKLSELEGVAIGIIQKNQPCTAYSIRVGLKSSPSSHWRASAGAMYPLLARLEKDGFLHSEADADDKRGRRLLCLTPLGGRALKAWVKGILNKDLLAEVSDPIRTRMFVLASLTRPEQIRLAQSMLDGLERLVIEAKDFLDERPVKEDRYAHLGAVGGLLNAQARVDFMRVVLDTLSVTERA